MKMFSDLEYSDEQLHQSEILALEIKDLILERSGGLGGLHILDMLVRLSVEFAGASDEDPLNGFMLHAHFFANGFNDWIGEERDKFEKFCQVNQQKD